MSGGHLEPESASEARVRRVLGEARRRWFLKAWTRIATETALVAVVGLLAAWLVFRLTAPGPGVLLLLAGAVLAIVVTFLAGRARPLWRRPGDRLVARYVEERAPEFDELIVSAVDALDRPTGPALRPLLLADAARRLDGLDLDRIVSRGLLRARALQLAGAGLLLLATLVALREPLLQTWDTLRMALAPPVITFEVAPGDTRVREGSAITLRARVRGLPARAPKQDLLVRLDLPGRDRDLPMEDRDGWQEVVVDRATTSFTYRVAGYGTVSPEYRVDVRPTPRVSRIDVHYQFPAFSGLPPRVDEDSGDIYAPAGTKVRLVVHTTVPVSQVSLGLASGARVPLAAADVRRLEGELAIAKDDAYRLTLVEQDGSRTDDDTEYFVRTVDDRPPDVRIVRPANDRKVTRLEEVAIEVQADDDFGVDRLELVYATRGGVEKTVRLPASGGVSATGRHTLFIEDLDVQPGDFVSYYAKARDVGRGKRPTEARSDIFFLEVRPFSEEFEVAQSAAMGNASGGQFDDLAERQKELIIATWKLERRSAAGRSATDIRALAEAQAELKKKTEQLAARLSPRAAQRRMTVGPNQPGARPESNDPMRRAVEAMERSRAALEALQTSQAIPHEMEALNQLLRAQAEITRRQIMQQQSAGGRGGQSGNQDLSALFDRELQRQQQTKYENRSSSQQHDDEDEESRSLDRLRELARRQDELSKRQQELARQRAQMAAEEVKRQLEKLTREQEELRRQVEQLARQMQQRGGDPQSSNQRSQEGSRSGPSTGGQGGTQGRESLQRAAESMQQSAGGMNREQLEQAAEQARQAAEQLRRAEQSLASRQPDEGARVAGEMQLEAAQIAEQERRVARELRESGASSADELRRLAGEQERAADRAARLADRARQAGAMGQPGATAGEGSGAGQRGENRDARADNTREGDSREDNAREGKGHDPARALAEGDIERQLRSSAQALRQMAERGQAGAGEGGEQKEADRAESVARSLEGTARGLGRTAGQGDDRERLSEQLARSGELRDRLSELTRQLREGGREAGQSPGSREGQQDATAGGPSDGSAQQRGEGQSSKGGEAGRKASPQGSSSGGQGSGTADGTPGPDEIGRELRALERLAEGLGENGEGLRRALQSLEGHAPSRSAPGTEAWKQDFAKWESLRKEIAQSLDAMEAKVSSQLQAGERENRLDAGASDAAPEQYRREVARYYRSLARKPQP